MSSQNVDKQFYSSVIPSAFFLGGIKVKVKVAIESAGQSPERTLIADYDSHQITLYPEATSQAILEQAYFRGLTRAILNTQGRKDLVEDSGFTDSFANMLHQASITSQGWPDPFLALASGASVDSAVNCLGDAYDGTESCEDDYDFQCDEQQDHCDAYWDDMAEEEDHLEGCREHWDEFSDYADDWARSDDEGWFYDE